MAGMVCELCGWTGGSKSERGTDDVETVEAGSYGTFEVEDDAVDLEAGLVVIESGCPECDADLEIHLGPAPEWLPHEATARGEICQNFDPDSGCTHTTYDHPALDESA
ncbi:MAG: hypothetical protein ACI8U4_000477 [Natronomonas sp.]|jgi:hypothetical protein